MEECKDLLHELSSTAAPEKEIEKLEQKLIAKEKEVLACTIHLSDEETAQIIDILTRKTVCANKWGNLSSDTFQLI